MNKNEHIHLTVILKEILWFILLGNFYKTLCMMQIILT